MYIKTYPQISWSKLNIFLQCHRCFYKVVVLGMKRPGIDRDLFSLNNRIDALLKKEFDYYRSQKIPHPIMLKHQIDAIPFAHPSLFEWRDYRTMGIKFFEMSHSLELCGVIDDIWINTQQKLIVVDYKSTSKLKLPENKWDIQNKKQLDFYSYLINRCGYEVHNVGYFIYISPASDQLALNQKLELEMVAQACVIDYEWIEPTIQELRNCIDQKAIPEPNNDCDFCKYESLTTANIKYVGSYGKIY